MGELQHFSSSLSKSMPCTLVEWPYCAIIPVIFPPWVPLLLYPPRGDWKANQRISPFSSWKAISTWFPLFFSGYSTNSLNQTILLTTVWSPPPPFTTLGQLFCVFGFKIIFLRPHRNGFGTMLLMTYLLKRSAPIYVNSCFGMYVTAHFLNLFSVIWMIPLTSLFFPWASPMAIAFLGLGIVHFQFFLRASSFFCRPSTHSVTAFSFRWVRPNISLPYLRPKLDYLRLSYFPF